MDNLDDTCSKLNMSIKTPAIADFVALILRDHEPESVNRQYVRCRCTPQVFRSNDEHRKHVAAIIVQKLDDLMERAKRETQD